MRNDVMDLVPVRIHPRENEIPTVVEHLDAMNVSAPSA